MAKLSFGQTYNRPPVSVGGGIGQGLDIAFASYEQLRLVDNSNAAAAALEDAYAARTRAVKDATGIDLGNPLFGEAAEFDPAQAQRLARGEFGAELTAQGNRAEAQKAAYAERLAALEKQFPDKAGIIRSAVPVERDAEAIAKAADDRLSMLMASNPDWSSYAWSFAGGAAGSFRDPLVVGSLAFGGGPGAARTVAGRILTVAFKEALLNGATTAVAQPFVQDWRRRAGLPNGFDEAATNVLFAAGLGGVLGSAGAGIGELLTSGARRAAARDLVEQFALENPELGETARRALKGDTSAATTLLSEIRDVLPDDVRGAIDAAAELESIEAQRQAHVAYLSQQRHEELLSRAERSEQIRALPDQLLEDTARINRLVRELAPRADSIIDREGVLGDLPDFDNTIRELRAGVSADEAARRPVSTFIKRLGGIDPNSPIAAELKAIGVDSRSFPGLYSREGRKALDNIPVDELPEGLRLHAGADDGNGYVREQAFVDGVQAELEGRPWRGADEVVDNSAQHLDEYRAYLEANGVDLERMSDAQVREQLIAIDDAERRFLAAEPNQMGLSTDEVSFLPPGVTRRAYTAEVVREILSRAGDVPDDVVKMAADTHIAAGETLEDAIDFALSNAAGVRKTLPESNFAELGSEPPAPKADAPIDPPDEDAIDWGALEELGFGSGAAIPFGDDVISLAALKADLEETAWLENVVTACKL